MSERLQILLLEGSAKDARCVIEALKNGGIKADIQHRLNGKGIAALLEQNHWDILLCNFQLADISAIDVLEIVQRLGLDLPVIVLSGGIGEELAISAMHAGAHDFISKANLSRLIPAIERELEELVIHRQRRKAETALRESEQRFRQLTENIGEVFWLIDIQTGEMIYLSPAFEEVWEQPNGQLQSRPEFLFETIHPDDYYRVSKAIKTSGWIGFNEEYRILLPTGEVRWISTRSFPIRDAQGHIYRVAGLSIDVSERMKLTAEREMMSRAIEQSADAVLITDAEGAIVYVNPAFEKVSGYTMEDLLGQTPSVLKSGFQDEAFYASVWKNLSSGLPFTDIFINRRKDGELYYEAKTITPVCGANGELTHYVSTGKDITERLKSRERLHKLVHYDAVTGLANHVLLKERMEQVILHAEQVGEYFGVMCVGVAISEMLGEMQSKSLVEKLQYQVGQRLQDTVESCATLARLGMDEFLILLPNFSRQEDLEKVAKMVVLAFAEPISADGYELFISPTVGISLYPGDGSDSETLIKHAELAMKYVREQDNGPYGFYVGEMEPRQKHLSS